LLSSENEKDTFRLGYNFVRSAAKNGSAPGVSKNEYGVGEDYRNARFYGNKPIDNTFSGRNLGIGTSLKEDNLNTFSVLKGNGKTLKEGIGEKEWKPYEDDLIAFFFYDIVNDRYIPFRATVKGINESMNIQWDDIKFIGRADTLYSYNGFTRQLGFNFQVVVGSLSELHPVWKKINYLCGLAKPANYNSVNKLGTSFMIPPMVLITIGDMYKNQPIVMTGITVNVPENATWETLSEENSSEWTYLNGIIQSKNKNILYGQYPMEADISITCNLLEKEKAITGGANFGHAPRVVDWNKDYYDKTYNERFKNGGKDLTNFSKELIVENENSKADSDAEQRERERLKALSQIKFSPTPSLDRLTIDDLSTGRISSGRTSSPTSRTSF
jgi:hypothetical protein